MAPNVRRLAALALASAGLALLLLAATTGSAAARGRGAGAPAFLAAAALAPRPLARAAASGAAAAARAAGAPAAHRVAAEAAAGGSLGLAVGAAAAALALCGAKALRRRGAQVARRANLVATRADQVIPWWDRMIQPRVEEGIGVWAEKLNMTSIFQEVNGNWQMLPATILVIKRGGNIVTEKKWPEKHGYYSVQVGYDRYIPPEEHLKDHCWGRRIATLARSEIPPLKKLREFTMRPHDWEKYEIGQKIWPSDIFVEGDIVDVHSRSKGRGYQGAITKWGHHRGPMTHGSKHHRRYGSVGPAHPSRSLPGSKMPGWAGDHNHTQKRIKILKIIDRIDEDNMPESIIVVAGTVAGYSAHTDKGGSYVYLHKMKNLMDGRFKRDPVWMWYAMKGEGYDQMKPLKDKAWTTKTMWGRDVRWIAAEVKKYWPDGFPGYDHSTDPFYDECDPRLAIKALDW